MRLARCLIVVLVVSFGLVLVAPTRAQDATPMAAPVACDGPEASADDLLALWYADDGTQATPTFTEDVTEVVIPVLPVADEATTAAIEATVQGVFACFAAGDFLRSFAFFTEDLQRAFGPEPGTSREEAAGFLSMAPAPDPTAGELIAVTDVVLLPDGQAAAFVVERDAESGTTFTSYAIFEQVDGQWRVDYVWELSDSEGDES